MRRTVKQRIALFWPGDGRDRPNELALPAIASLSWITVSARRTWRHSFAVMPDSCLAISLSRASISGAMNLAAASVLSAAIFGLTLST